MAVPGPSGTGRARSSSWQEKLQGKLLNLLRCENPTDSPDHCRSNQYHPPIFNIVSDRRGGRTAWSSTVTIPVPNSPPNQQTVQARYWYDGTYINNAKEDAAEVALRVLTGGGAMSSPVSPSTPSGSSMSSGWGRAAPSPGPSAASIGVGAAWPKSPPIPPSTGGRW